MVLLYIAFQALFWRNCKSTVLCHAAYICLARLTILFPYSKQCKSCSAVPWKTNTNNRSVRPEKLSFLLHLFVEEDEGERERERARERNYSEFLTLTSSSVITNVWRQRFGHEGWNLSLTFCVPLCYYTKSRALNCSMKTETSGHAVYIHSPRFLDIYLHFQWF